MWIQTYFLKTLLFLSLTQTGSAFLWMTRQPIRCCGSQRAVLRSPVWLITSLVRSWIGRSDMSMLHRYSVKTALNSASHGLCQISFPSHSYSHLYPIRFFAKKASWASEATGRWNFQDGWSSVLHMNVQGGGTAKGPAASERTRSPGVSVGVVPATTPGTKARVKRSRKFPSAPQLAFILTSLLVS